MKKRAFSFFAMAVLVAGYAHGGTSHGIQTYELTYEFSGYIPCLGQVVDVEEIIEVRYHEFETKAGTIHVVDNWSIHQFVSDPLGRVWLGEGVSPFHFSAKLTKGEVMQWISHIRYAPQTPDTPRFMFENHFKVTVDANGELRVLHDEAPPEDWFRCLPNKK